MAETKNAQIKRGDYRSGVIQATMRAILGDKRAHAFDAFPQHKSRRSKAQSAEQVRANFKALIASQKLQGTRA